MTSTTVTTTTRSEVVALEQGTCTWTLGSDVQFHLCYLTDPNSLIRCLTHRTHTGTILTDDGDEAEAAAAAAHSDDDGDGIALSSSSRGSSDSSSGGGMRGGSSSGSRSWPSFSGGVAEGAGDAGESANAGTATDDDPLAAALLPRGKRAQRRYRSGPRQQGRGREEAWVVEVAVQEEAYMTVLGGETQVG